MTLESALFAALSAVTGALIYVCKLLWEEVKDCKTDRLALREEIEEVKEEMGVLKGTQKAYDLCPMSACPFRAPKGGHNGLN
jgi:hypothetical protein